MIGLDVLFNIYGASEGAAHPSAVAAALYALMYNEALAKAVAAGKSSYAEDHNPYHQRDVIHWTFAAEMGWTPGELELFLDGPYDTTPEGAMEFEKARDVYREFVKHNSGK